MLKHAQLFLNKPEDVVLSQIGIIIRLIHPNYRSTFHYDSIGIMVFSLGLQYLAYTLRGLYTAGLYVFSALTSPAPWCQFHELQPHIMCRC